RIKDTCDAVNLGGFKRFLKGEGRKDGGDSLGEHGFAGPRGADHEDIVASGAGNFEGTLGGLLSANIFEVDEGVLGVVEEVGLVDFEGSDDVVGVYEADLVDQGTGGVSSDAAVHRRFAGVKFGNLEAGDPALAGFDGDGKRTANAGNPAIQREVTDKK